MEIITTDETIIRFTTLTLTAILNQMGLLQGMTAVQWNDLKTAISTNFEENFANTDANYEILLNATLNKS